MGLTIHYQLAATGDEANARKLVQQLRQAALGADAGPVFQPGGLLLDDVEDALSELTFSLSVCTKTRS